jgi:outer membrane protein assembly factor BamA
MELFGRSTYEFSLLDPYFRKGDTSVELSMFDTQRHQQFVGSALVSTSSDQYEERRRGGYLRVGRPLSEHSAYSVMFRSEQVASAFFQGVRTLSPLTGPAQANPAQTWTSISTGGYTWPQLGPFGEPLGPGDRPGPIVIAAPLHPGGRLASLTFGLTQDFRDNPNEPVKGAYRRFSLETAGRFLGGEEEFRKLTAEYRRFMPVHGKDVLAARIMGGISNGNVPLFETYSVGGANTLRGYEEERFRGERFLLANLEYRRAVTDKLTGVLFVDAGDAYGGAFTTPMPGFTISAEDQSMSWHVGAGFGLRVITPLGPLRFDIGFGSEGSRPHFNFGHTF